MSKQKDVYAECRKEEAVPRITADRLNLILQSIKEGFFVLDLSWNFVYANKQITCTIGQTPKDWIGKNIWEMFPQYLGTIVEESYREVMEKRIAKYFEIEGKYSGKWLMVSVYPSVEGIAILTQDITERKKAEIASEENKDRLQNIMDAINDGIVLIGLDGKVMDCNNASLNQLGLTREELLGKDVTSFIVPDEREKSINENRCKVQETGNALAQVRALRKNKSTFFAEVSITALYDKNKKQIGLLGVSRDITERKKSEAELELYRKDLERLVVEKTAQLKKAERLATIGETAGMVGHDIRNPLQAMIGDVYLLKDYLTTMPEMPIKNDVGETLESLEKNINYINKIVADLQDYARPLKPQYANVDLSEITTNVIKDSHVPDNIKVDVSSNTFQKITTEPTFIRRILTNLVSNAIQAMPNGGNLELAILSKENKAYLTVGDNGVGISEDVKPKLFSPMFTTKSKGQGLGLAVVKRLVEALNGNISFESKEGKGTKFTIQIPLN